MVGDSLAELHAFAEQICVKSHFWHKQGRLSHYDITSEQHVIALTAGAMLVSSREIVSRSYVMNAESTPAPIQYQASQPQLEQMS